MIVTVCPPLGFTAANWISAFTFPQQFVLEVKHGNTIRKILWSEFPYLESETPDAANQQELVGNSRRHWTITYKFK